MSDNAGASNLRCKDDGQLRLASSGLLHHNEKHLLSALTNYRAHFHQFPPVLPASSKFFQDHHHICDAAVVQRLPLLDHPPFSKVLFYIRTIKAKHRQLRKWCTHQCSATCWLDFGKAAPGDIEIGTRPNSDESRASLNTGEPHYLRVSQQTKCSIERKDVRTYRLVSKQEPD